MCKLLSVLLMFCLLRLVMAQSESPPARIPVGTRVEIELLDNLSSENLHNGESVSFRVVTPVVVNGATQIAGGTPIIGEVKGVQSAHSWHKAGSFDLVFPPLLLEDGSVVQLDFRRPKLQGTRGEKTATAIGTSIALAYYFPLVPVALIAGARKGQPYQIRAGERYLVYVVSSWSSAELPAETALPSSESPK